MLEIIVYGGLEYNGLEFPTPTEAAVVETDSYTFIVEQLVFRYFALSA